MSSYQHRSTRNPLAELTIEERELVTLGRLASEVGAACDKWLAARGIRPIQFNRDLSTTIKPGTDQASQANSLVKA